MECDVQILSNDLILSWCCPLYTDVSWQRLFCTRVDMNLDRTQSTILHIHAVTVLLGIELRSNGLDWSVVYLIR